MVRKVSSLIIIVFLGLAACNQVAISSVSSEMGFLKRYNLSVNKNPTILELMIPSDWQVRLGEYPIGLYWGLANEYSKDVGLDLTAFKGKRVEAHIYELVDGLPGSGEQAIFSYPSNVILIIDNRRVIGAWLAFNIQGLGPSVKRRTLTEITGLNFEEWLKSKHYFENSSTDNDLESLTPTQVIDTFFDSINKGDKTRAYSCLSPQILLQSLTVNLEPGHLYNAGFNQVNSIVDNIVRGKPIQYLRVFDPDNFLEIKDIGQRKRVEIEVNLELEWKDSAFNSSDGKSVRFAVLTKYDKGWKLEGLGTGP
ncbi:DUF4830 domain-containing protein [Desulfosporosinus sp. PR]|uniref:DUF4830 domain-containing protein n=1 Tax=Candidatus Desulfosporosinus nitrosoreducens TaxID=3401928 RepID=UPI0027F38BE6|nr:DUF4830 domain-containing protein [Desulfosporosinus sp. PR]MDQ7096772.1 DUF4830 domain-containing protein [Desulfosporosinus sp. PR]